MTRPAEGPGPKLTPYWWEAAPCDEAEPAEVPAAIDVAIVGAGFTGLSAALTLARAGRSVVLFDAMRAAVQQAAEVRYRRKVAPDMDRDSEY